MKITRILETREFQPITLEITIESRKELSNLWHRLNIAPAKVKDNSHADGPVRFHWMQEVNTTSHKLFSIIDDLVKREGE